MRLDDMMKIGDNSIRDFPRKLIRTFAGKRAICMNTRIDDNNFRLNSNITPTKIKHKSNWNAKAIITLQGHKNEFSYRQNVLSVDCWTVYIPSTFHVLQSDAQCHASQSSLVRKHTNVSAATSINLLFIRKRKEKNAKRVECLMGKRTS